MENKPTNSRAKHEKAPNRRPFEYQKLIRTVSYEIRRLAPTFMSTLLAVAGVSILASEIYRNQFSTVSFAGIFLIILAAMLGSRNYFSVSSLLRPEIPTELEKDEDKKEKPLETVETLKSKVRFELRKTKISVEYSSLSSSGKAQCRSLLREAENLTEQASLESELRYAGELIELASRLTNAIRNDSRVVLIYTIIGLIAIAILAVLTWNQWSAIAFGTAIFGVPIGVFIWSGIGGYMSVPYRYVFQQEEFQEPTVKWLVIRPIMGLVLGVVTYFAFSISLLLLDSNLNSSLLKEREIIYLFIAFFAGFSDRFAIFLLESIIGRVVPAWAEKSSIVEDADTDNMNTDNNMS